MTFLIGVAFICLGLAYIVMGWIWKGTAEGMRIDQITHGRPISNTGYYTMALHIITGPVFIALGIWVMLQ